MFNSPRLHLASWRGHAIEGVHPVHAILSKADGTVVERVGFDVETTWRSAAKPFQLEATLGLVPEDKQEETHGPGSGGRRRKPQCRASPPSSGSLHFQTFRTRRVGAALRCPRPHGLGCQQHLDQSA